MRKLLVVLGVILFLWAVGKSVQSSDTPSNQAAAVAATPVVDRGAEVTSEVRSICKGAETRAQRIAKAHLDWKPPGVALVACRRFAIGMTADMLRASLGKPETVNSTETVNGTHEQWVYGSDYIYVDDGIVTSYQTSR